MLTSIKRISPLLILILIILFHVINTFIWLQMDQSYLKEDSWEHLPL